MELGIVGVAAPLALMGCFAPSRKSVAEGEDVLSKANIPPPPPQILNVPKLLTLKPRVSSRILLRVTQRWQSLALGSSTSPSSLITSPFCIMPGSLTKQTQVSGMLAIGSGHESSSVAACRGQVNTNSASVPLGADILAAGKITRAAIPSMRKGRVVSCLWQSGDRI